MLLGKKKETIVLTVFLMAMLSIAAISVFDDENTSDGAVIDTLKIAEGETQNMDVSISCSLIVEGTYSGTVELISDSNTVYCELIFYEMSDFELYVNSGDPYIKGNMVSTDGSTGEFTIISGSLMLGNDQGFFTGKVYGEDGSVECNSMTNVIVSIDDSGLVISGDTEGYSDLGFSVTASATVTSSNNYTNDEDVTVSGILSNELLDNSITVSQKSDGSYVLKGSLAYIDRNGSSSVGTLFDLIVGDKNDFTHAVIIGTSEAVTTSDYVISLEGGQYLVCLSSNVSSIEVGDTTVSFSGLSMAAEGNKVTPYLAGLISTMTLNGDLTIGNLTVDASVDMIVQNGASVSSSSDLLIEGSLNIIGNADFTSVSSLSTSSDSIEGTIIVDGVMRVSDKSDDLNVHSMYYDSDSDRIYGSLQYVLDNSDGKVYISNSYMVDSSITIPSSKTLVNSGTLYLSDSVTFTNNGTTTNHGGIIISDSAQFYNVNGTLNNDGFIISYGLFTNKGSFTTKFYADVSYYNSTTTRFASISVMLNNVSSGDSLILRRDVTMSTDSNVPYGVTLSTNGWKLTVSDDIKFNVYGTIDVISDTTVYGTMNVYGTMTVGTSCELYAPGSLSVSGELNVNGDLSVESMTLTGTMNVVGNVTVTNYIAVGKDPSTLPYDNQTNITGKITLSDGAMAIVYGKVLNFNTKEVFNYTESTAFMISEYTYAYEYASYSDVKLNLMTPKISGVGFAQWLDTSGNTISGIHYVGDYKILVADTTTETFTVVLTYNEGITWIIDGYDIHQGGGEVVIPYGEHYFEVEVADDYSGSPVIWFITDSSTVQISQGEDITIIEDCAFKVTGVYKSGGDSQDNSLIIVLSAVIIVVVALLAVMTYLLIKKNKEKLKSQ